MNIEKFLEKPHKKFEDIEDVFNPGNRLSGYICSESSKFYGATYLTHINGMQCEQGQLILSSPKMNYPYKRSGKFLFYHTPDISPAYEKYDGTAIIAYAYRFRKITYVTYKTRMTPILQSFELYNFEEMWREILLKYPDITYLPTMEQTMVFELYGIRNKHLIIYPMPLDTVLLFGIDRKSDQILLPEEVCASNLGIPIPKVYYYINPSHDFEDFYKRIRGEIEDLNETTDDGIVGSEGSVVYVRDPDLGWIQWKAKPQSVMDIHCAPGLSKRDIITTCYNALENVDLEDMTYRYIKELLMEEITSREVESRKPLVLKCIEEVKEEVYIRSSIIEKYKECGMSLKENKQDVMQYMSKIYPREQIRYVYAILSAMEGGSIGQEDK